ncbi:MAG: DUF1559 domain-containing protein [Pirellula sp.]|nr:DUF1559 domain-containing protein [Pirellula sp.]
MQCSNNLKQLGLALHNYESSFKTFPPSGIDSNSMSWAVMVLPFVEQGNLYNQFNFTAGAWNSHNRIAVVKGALIPSLQCPSAPPDSIFSAFNTTLTNLSLNESDVRTSHYHGVLGPTGPNAANNNQPYTVIGNPALDFGVVATQGALGAARVRTATYTVPERNPIGAITDGTSNTLLIGEFAWRNYQFWRPFTRGWFSDNRGTLLYLSKNVTYPINSGFSLKWNDGSFGSMHTGGAQFVRADGSVNFFSQSIDMATYRAAASRNGGETASIDP